MIVFQRIKRKETTTMFIKYLRNNDPDLLDKAGDLDINLEEFDPIYRLSAVGAKKALQQAIKDRVGTTARQNPHVRMFVEKHARDLVDFYRLRTRLEDLIEEYNDKNPGARLKFYPTSDKETRLVRKYSKAGESDSKPKEYDLKAFAQKVKAEGYDSTLRISPSGEPDRNDYVFAKLQTNGTISYNKTAYTGITEWVSAVYAEAIKDGRRTKSNAGNKWYAVSIQNKKSGEWDSFGHLYNRLMEETSTNGVDGAEEPEEEDLEEEETEE